jgi:3-methyladenine DNA glycosylase AlkD
MSAEPLADAIARRIDSLPDRRTAALRGVRREYSRMLRDDPPEQVLEMALALTDRYRWVAYELLYHHPGGVAALDTERVERLGRGIGDWGATDAFGRYVSGPAWLHRRVADADVQRWTGSPDRWWRRAALVSTVPLNLRAAGGTGDTARTLEISGRLVADRDDMVVKALSWALRALAVHDPEAVRAFLRAHADRVAPRVRREVTSKLETGRKTPPARRRA